MSVTQRIYTQFQGGINTRIGPVVVDGGEDQAMNFCENSQNWQTSEVGIAKRAGFVTEGIYPGPITGTIDFTDSSGLSQIIVCSGANVYANSPTTTIFTGQTPGNYYQGLTWTNETTLTGGVVLILMNGVDKPLVYDGSTCSQLVVTDDPTSPIWNDARPQGAASFRGSILFWGDPNNPYRIYKAAPGSYSNFDNTQNTVDAFDMDPDGGFVTGIKVFTNNLLIIYQQYAIRRLSGSQPFSSAAGDPYFLTEVTKTFGCIAPRTIVGDEFEHYFLANDGLRQLKPIQGYGDMDPTQPTYPIQDLVNETNFSPDAIINACALYSPPDKQIYLCLPTGSSPTNNRVICFNVVTRGSDLRGDGDINAACVTLNNRVFWFGDYAGNVNQITGESYNGTPINAVWLSKIIAHGGISLYKRYKFLILYADSDNGGDIIVQYNVLRRGSFQYNTNTQSVTASGALWDVALWDQALWASDSQNIFFIKNPGRGNGIQIQLSSVSGTQLPNIRQIEIIYETFGAARG